WSQYQEILYDKDMNLPYLESCAKQFKREDPKKAGSYQYVDLTDPSVTAKDALCVEAVNAVLMYRLATTLPDGANKVNTAFYKGNYPWRSMEGFLKGFCKLYPSDAQNVSEILDQMTGNKMSEAEIRKLCGNVTLNRPATIAVSESSPSAPIEHVSSPTPTAAAAPTSSEGLALKAEFEKTYLALVKAAQEGKEDVMRALQEKMQNLRRKMNAIAR
nr:hypothetical protein [Candidatus Ozemobacteraceae bacterium]